MVAIGTSNDFLCRKIKTASFQKQITPFSIDDILANPRPIGKEETNEKSTFDCPHHFHPGSVSLSSLNQDMHLQWLANLHRLCMLSACQPFWYSTLTIDRKHFLANNRIFGDSSRHHFFNLESYTKIFKSSSEVSARPKEVRKRKRSDNIKSVRSNSSPKLFKIGQNLKTEKPDLRSPSISSFETDNGQTEDRPISNETSGLDSPLSALEKLTSATFIGMEKKKHDLHTVTSGRETTKTKRRKCRTAFTAFQLSVLEQRFNCHKYLTPTDRDQISSILGLSSAQVITWFQNRRAKQKRDLEEMKNDIKTVEKSLRHQSRDLQLAWPAGKNKC